MLSNQFYVDKMENHQSQGQDSRGGSTFSNNNISDGQVAMGTSGHVIFGAAVNVDNNYGDIHIHHGSNQSEAVNVGGDGSSSMSLESSNSPMEFSGLSLAERNAKFCIEAHRSVINQHIIPSECKDVATNLKVAGFITDAFYNELMQTADEHKVEKLISEILKCNQPGWHQAFLDALRNYDLKHVADLLLGEHSLSDVEQEQQALLWILYRQFLSRLEPNDVLLFYGSSLLDDTSRQDVYSKATQQERLRWFLYLLVKRPNWHHNLITALRDPNCGNYSDLADLLDVGAASKSKTDDDVEEMVVDMHAEAGEELQESSPSLSERLGESPKPAVDASVSSKQSDRVDNSVPVDGTKQSEIEHEPLKLRNYQTELVAQALTGSNSLIIAPTGSGKTVMAVKICMEHMKVESKDKKIIFVCPTENLVSQQCKLFKKYIPNDQLQEMTGAIMLKSGIRREDHIEQTKMTFMTAQMLVNLLRDGEFTIERISLMVFDECHHTRSEHPYNIIMNFYHDKLANLSQVKPSLPQIVGMTASPGVDKAKTMEEARDRLVGLIANLDVTQPPAVVREFRDELSRFIADQHNVIISVKENKTQPFQLGVEQVMKKIEEQITSFKAIETPPHAKGTPGYEQWVIELCKTFREEESDPQSLPLVTYTEALRKFNDGLHLNDHVNTKRAKQYLEENLKLNEERNNQAEKNISQFYNNHVSSTPDEDSALLTRLNRVLTDEFHSCPQSQCIIFAKTRMVVSALAACLNTEPSLTDLELNVKEFKGDGKQYGMNKTKQDRSLQEFREGKSKVLVATSAAEEGVDVAKCNLVIQYNYSTDHVGHTQRQGRKRAKESKSMVIAYEESEHISKSSTDRIKAQLALEAAETFVHDNPDDLTSRVRNTQRQNEAQRKFVSQKREDAKSSTVVYDLDCARCKTHITKSDRFRMMGGNHHVAIDINIREKTIFSPRTKKHFGHEQTSIGKLLCGNRRCKQELAGLMIHNDVAVPVLKISSFRVHAPGKPPSNPKKWKFAPFKVTVELGNDDLLSMCGLFDDCHPIQVSDAGVES